MRKPFFFPRREWVPGQPCPFFLIRKGEWWIGPIGLFFSRDLNGIELPSGRFVGFHIVK